MFYVRNGGGNKTLEIKNDVFDDVFYKLNKETMNEDWRED